MNALFSLLQQGPAETTNYMVAGYAVIFGIMGIYLVSLFMRLKNTRQELELLDEITPQEPSEDRSS